MCAVAGLPFSVWKARYLALQGRRTFEVRFYLSATPTLDGSSTLLTTKTVRAKNFLPGGVLKPITGKATVPGPSQGKYILCLIDAADAIVD